MSTQKVVVYRSSAVRASTAQTDRDNAEVLMRMQRMAATYKPMERLLECLVGSRLTRDKLFTLADRVCAERIIADPPDRLCRRKKEALLCWFCEHFAQIFEQANTIAAGPSEPAPGEATADMGCPEIHPSRWEDGLSGLDDQPAWPGSTAWEDGFTEPDWDL